MRLFITIMAARALLVTNGAIIPAPSAGVATLRRVVRRRWPCAVGSSSPSHRPLVVVATAAAGQNPIRVTFSDGGKSTEVPGSGGIVGSGGGSVVVVKGGDVDSEHAKLELRQGRIFLTALSKDKGTFLGGSRLFPGVAYAVAEGAVVTLGAGDGAVEVAVEQVGEVSDAGVDMMAKIMQMQFESTMSPEVRAALKDDDDEN